MPLRMRQTRRLSECGRALCESKKPRCCGRFRGQHRRPATTSPVRREIARGSPSLAPHPPRSRRLPMPHPAAATPRRAHSAIRLRAPRVPLPHPEDSPLTRLPSISSPPVGSTHLPGCDSLCRHFCGIEASVEREAACPRLHVQLPITRGQLAAWRDQASTIFADGDPSNRCPSHAWTVRQ